MPNEICKIAGSKTLAQIESAIQFEEQKSLELVAWTIENNKDNLVELKDFDPFGSFPKDLKLTLASDPAPAGHAAAVGPLPMMVGGQKKDVRAWRKQ